MLISEFISQLTALKSAHGDHEVIVDHKRGELEIDEVEFVGELKIMPIPGETSGVWGPAYYLITPGDLWDGFELESITSQPT